MDYWWLRTAVYVNAETTGDLNKKTGAFVVYCNIRQINGINVYGLWAGDAGYTFDIGDVLVVKKYSKKFI